MAELTELVSYLSELLCSSDKQNIPAKLMSTLKTGKDDFFNKWLECFPDLSTDNF